MIENGEERGFQKRLYRPDEAARSLAISRGQVYNLMASGDLKSVKIGASRRITAVDLDAYVEHLRAQVDGNSDNGSDQA